MRLTWPGIRNIIYVPRMPWDVIGCQIHIYHPGSTRQLQLATSLHCPLTSKIKASVTLDKTYCTPCNSNSGYPCPRTFQYTNLHCFFFFFLKQLQITLYCACTHTLAMQIILTGACFCRQPFKLLSSDVCSSKH